MRRHIRIREGAASDHGIGIVVSARGPFGKREKKYPDMFLPMASDLYFIVRGRFWKEAFPERLFGQSIEFPLFLEASIMADVDEAIARKP